MTEFITNDLNILNKNWIYNMLKLSSGAPTFVSMEVENIKQEDEEEF